MKNANKIATIAIIKKDFKAVTADKQLFSALLIVPLVLTIILPSILVLSLHFMSGDLGELEDLLRMIPISEQSQNINITVLSLLLNNILPLFFLIIPIMTSSVMSASAFVGEKEQRTLETLLYCPLSVEEIFRSKVLASFLLSMMVSFISFFAMQIVLGIEIFATTGSFVFPSMNWLIIMLLLAPAISIVAISLIVKSSAKSQTVIEAQQKAVFLILPLILIIVAQFMGVMLVSELFLLILGVGIALIAWLVFRKLMGKFSYEGLLR